jgi:GntR family transcriptional repressor for pyruvate dehydrogenase complex
MEGELRPVERRRVYDSIVDQIKQLITDGTWKPGQRLPSERELTEMLSVGRTSVREALRILEAMGFVKIRAGDGSYVQDSVAASSRLYNLVNLIEGDEYIVDLMEAREMIESQIAFMAAESATLKDVAALEAIVSKQATAIESGGSGIGENIEFHLRLTQATGNRVLLELQQIFFQLSHETIAQLFRVPGRPQESVEQHRAIILAVKEHRPIDAHRLMLHHLRSRYKLPEDPASAQSAEHRD